MCINNVLFFFLLSCLIDWSQMTLIGILIILFTFKIERAQIVHLNSDNAIKIHCHKYTDEYGAERYEMTNHMRLPK